MAKLVAAKTFVSRHFEPGSEPDSEVLEQWVNQKGLGVMIGDLLFIWDNALFGNANREPHKLSGTDLLRKA